MPSHLPYWDPTTDYATGDTVIRNGNVYTAKVSTGPSIDNVTDPAEDSGQAIWKLEGALPLVPDPPSPPPRPPGPGEVPMQVSGLRIEETDDGLVTVAWDANVDLYEVQWRTADQEFSDQRSKETSDLRAILKGLTNGTRHYIRVRAKNASMGDGAWSRVVIATPAMPPVPDMPEAPVASSARGGVAWSWTLPDDNGSPIIDFDLQWKERDDADWTLVENITNTNHTVEVADLSGRFLAQVRARNATGHGEWSPESALTDETTSPLARMESLEHVFTAGETWLWPHDDLDSAVVVMRSASGTVGEVVCVRITDVSLGDALVIVVGSKGAGGSGGAGGTSYTIPAGTAGGDGVGGLQDGYVRIYPTC